MITNGGGTPRESHWLVALHDAIASDGKLTEIDVPPDDDFESLRDCLHLLEHARRVSAPQTPPTHIGRFEILRELGSGAFGLVFLAIDPKVNRQVALKVPRPEVLSQPGLRRRFLHEAQAAGALEHPNLVPVFETGEHGPICFIASAYCDGGNLAQWLKGRIQRVSEREAAGLIEALARGVDHAHRRGVLHRDIKPSNVMLSRGAEDAAAECRAMELGKLTPRLTDFGLAKVLKLGDGHTHNGTLLGTPAYMAPEQADGRTAQVGAATDVYALGVLLFETLAGTPPFRGESDVQTLQLVARGDAPRLCQIRPGVATDLDAIVQRCLEHDPLLRYATASDLAADLGRFLRGEPTHARPATYLRRVSKWTIRHPALAALVLVSSMALATLTGGGWWYSWQVAQARDAARTRELESRRLWCVANTSLAHRAVNSDQLEHALALLNQTAPGEGEADLRGFPWKYLWGLLHEEEGTLRGHFGEVYCARYSPDGRLLASAGQDRTIRIWDMSNQQCLRVLNGHTNDVNGIAFSPSGLQLASACDDGKVRVWDVDSGKIVREWIAHPHGVFCLAYSPDGARLLSGGRSERALVWSTSTWKVLGSLNSHSPAVHAVQFSPSGHYVGTAGDDGTARLWNADTYAEIHTIAQHRGPLSAIDFSKNGENVLIASRKQRQIDLYDVAPPKLIRELCQTYECVHAAVFFDDDRRAAIATKDGQLQIRQTSTGGLMRKLRGHATRVWSLAASPNQCKLASAGADGTIKIWDGVAPGVHECIARQDDFPTCLAFSPDGRRVAVGGSHAMSMWDVATRQPIWQMENDFEICGDFDADGRLDSGYYENAQWHMVLSGSYDDQTDAGHIWKFGETNDVPVVGDWNGDGKDDLGVFRPSNGTWYFDLDGRGLSAEASLCFGQTVKDGTVQYPIVGRWNGGTTDQVALATRRDDQWVFTAPLDMGEVQIVASVGRGLELVPLAGRREASEPDHFGLFDGSRRWLESMPDGDWIPSASPSLQQPPKPVLRCKTIRQPRLTGWNDRSNALAALGAASDRAYKLAGDRRVGSVAHSPNGKLVAMAHEYDFRVKLLAAETGARRGVLHSSHGRIQGLAFIADGKLAIATEDGYLEVWDAEKRIPQIGFQAYPHSMQKFAASPDGRALAVAEHGTIKVWTPDGEEVAILGDTEKPYEVNCLAFSPDGTLLAAGGDNRLITLWRIATRDKVAQLAGHAANIVGITLCADGLTIATADAGDVVKLWDLFTREEVFTLYSADGTAAALSFSPDGRQLYAGVHDARLGGLIEVWSDAPLSQRSD